MEYINNRRNCGGDIWHLCIICSVPPPPRISNIVLIKSNTAYQLKKCEGINQKCGGCS